LLSLISLQFTLKGLSFDGFGLLLVFFKFQYHRPSRWLAVSIKDEFGLDNAEWRQPKRIEGIKKAEFLGGARLFIKNEKAENQQKRRAALMVCLTAVVKKRTEI
jgi:hypothetical protein